MPECPSSVSGFVEALRQYADYLETEPAMASIDSHADFFVACANLTYDNEFQKYMQRDMKRLKGFVKFKSSVEWWQVVVNWFGAVAEYAYNSDKASVQTLPDDDASAEALAA
jgi:hypothetical protein